MKEIEIYTKDENEYILRFGKLPDEVLTQIEISKAINKCMRGLNERNNHDNSL